VNTREWPPFFNGMFAYLFGQTLVVLAIRFLLGEWPDDPLLLLPYMTVAYGAVAGAIVTALAFAPVIYWVRGKNGARPWFETLAMTGAAFLGSLLLLGLLLGPLLSAYVPVMMVIAAVLPAGGAAASALAYWMLAGPPR
jgi:hypothetical protein